MRLIPASPDLLTAVLAGPAALGNKLGVDIGPGWPQSMGTFATANEFLKLFPEQVLWSTYFFLDDRATVLLGSGGFKGEPVDGSVEIGYEVVPCWRGQGVATRAVTGLIDIAQASREVRVVTAETAGNENASVGVLRKVGFTRVGAIAKPQSLETWIWELPISTGSG